MAEGTIKTVLEISGEGTYRNKLKEIGQALKGVASEEKVLNAEFGRADASLGKLVQQHQLLENRLKLQKERLAAIRQEYERVAAAEGENSTKARKLGADYNYAAAQVAETERSIQELTAQIDKSGGAWNRMSGWIDKNEAKLQKIGGTVERVAGRLSRALTAATAAVVTYSGKAFMEFEDEMAVVSTLVDEAETDMAELSRQALEASDNSGRAATEIAQGAYQAISAGVDPAKAMAVTEKAAKGAKAGLSDTKTVIDGLTSSMNAWKISYDQSESVLDKMITTQNEGKTTLGDLANNMGKVTAFAPQLGVSLEETLAATAALTKNGYGTESAMTALRNVMSAVIKPTSQAKEAAKELGLEFDAAAVRSKGLVGFLRDVQDKTKGDEEALGRLFGSVEGLGGVMLLSGSAAGDFADALGKIENSAGALEKAFGERTASRAEKMNMALNRMRNAAISFGQTLAPYIDMAAGAVEKLADKLGGMSEAEQKTLLNTAAWLIGGTKMISLAGKLTANLKGVVSVLGALGTGAKAIGALAGAGGVLAGAAAGVAAIGAALYGVGYAADQMSAAAKVKNAFSGLEIDTEKVDAVKTKAEEVRAAVEGLYSQEAQFSADTNTFFGDYITWLTDGLPETQEQVDGMKEKFAALVQTPYDAIEAAYNTRKAALDEALDSGVISKDLYDSQMARLESETGDAKNKVRALQEQFETFTDGAVAANTALNEGQIGILQGLREQIVGVTNDILVANSAALQAAELSEKRVRQGEGSAEDYALAVEKARVEREVNQGSIQTQSQAVELQLRTQLDEAGTAEARAEIQSQIEDLEQTTQAALDGLSEEYNQSLNDLTAGMMAKFPELAEQMRQAAEKTHLAEEVYQALNSGDLSGEQMQALAEKLMMPFDLEQYENGTGFFQQGEQNRLKGWADNLMASVAEDIAGMDKSQLGEALTGLFAEIDSGALEDVDFSALGEALDAALTVIDLSDDGRTIGMSWTQGQAQGLAEGDPELQAAVRTSCEGTVNTAKELFDVHSPSKVFADIGRSLMEGLRNGIANNRRLITAALAQLQGQLRSAGRQSVSGWIGGVNSMRPALVSAYAGLARDAANAVRDKLEIRSPSRVLAWMGEMSVEGWIRGVNSRISAAEAAMERAVNPPRPRERSGAAARQETVVNNYYTYNLPYTGAFGARDARKASRELARVETARRTGKGG
ncbi:MAG: phage tail tape measure protein [Oscillospiraceae bacterium]|nr:phage tail tape measure protein [Oscillospiraceae bacterium]